MVMFNTVKVQGPGRKSSWAVQRSQQDGLHIVVGRYYQTQLEAELEAGKLNREASSRIMGGALPLADGGGGNVKTR